MSAPTQRGRQQRARRASASTAWELNGGELNAFARARVCVCAAGGGPIHARTGYARCIALTARRVRTPGARSAPLCRSTPRAAHDHAMPWINKTVCAAGLFARRARANTQQGDARRSTGCASAWHPTGADCSLRGVVAPELCHPLQGCRGGCPGSRLRSQPQYSSQSSLPASQSNSQQSRGGQNNPPPPCLFSYRVGQAVAKGRRCVRACRLAGGVAEVNG